MSQGAGAEEIGEKASRQAEPWPGSARYARGSRVCPAHEDVRIRGKSIHLQPFCKGPSQHPDPGFQPPSSEAETAAGRVSRFVLGTGTHALVGTRKAGEDRGDSSPSSHSAEFCRAHPTHFLGLAAANPSQPFACPDPRSRYTLLPLSHSTLGTTRCGPDHLPTS